MGTTLSTRGPDTDDAALARAIAPALRPLPPLDDADAFAAASDWGGPMEVKRVRPALPGSHEAALRAGAAAEGGTADTFPFGL